MKFEGLKINPALFLVLFCSIFVSCYKDYSKGYQMQSKTFGLEELIDWDTAFCSSINNPPTLIFNKAQQTNFNNRFYIRVPVSNSTGYFYFIKTNNQLNSIFVRTNSLQNQSSDGYVELVNFTSRTYKVIKYLHNKPDSVFTLKNFDDFFNRFIQYDSSFSTIQVRKTFVNAQPCIDPTSCPNNPIGGSTGSFWSWLSNVFSAIGNWIANIFSIDDGGSVYANGDAAFINWDYSSYITNGGSGTTGSGPS